MAAFNFIHSYDKHCNAQRARGLLRDLNPNSAISQGLVAIDFSNNDYLGLSQDKRLLAAAQQAGDRWGVGATGSRLLSGDSTLFHEFETRIARDKGTQAALIFNSGYQANSAVLAALCDKRVLEQEALVFFDKYNHASLYQGCFLADATLLRYRHNDMSHLGQLLARYENDSRPKIIVSETVFGMDGDIADVAALIALCEKNHALLYLDEAHATGLWGERGYGVSTSFDFRNIPHVIMGTFSKALGCAGGYIACDEKIKQYLINQCGGFIYSTAPSPLVVGAAYEAWKCVVDLNEERVRVFENAKYLRENLQALGLNVGLSTTQIIPIILEDEEKTLRAKDLLLEAGILVSAIRPPTVPPKTARLRVAINATHTKADLDKLIDFFSSHFELKSRAFAREPEESQRSFASGRVTKVGFIFSHGWGMSPAFWENLLPFFAEYPCIVWDSGYFGQPQQDIPVDSNIKWIGVGHSLGFSRLLESEINFSALIGIQSFLRFCAHHPWQAGTKMKVVERMEKALIANPTELLQNFYQQCGLKSIVSDNINMSLLREDLQYLKNHDASEKFMARKIPTYFLAANNDPIVPQTLSLETAEEFNVKLDFYESAHHGLGYYSAARCAKDINNFLDEIKFL